MRIVQVGTGSWGASWLRIVTRSPHWELAGVVDVDESALRRAADGAGIPEDRRFASLAEALAAEPVDAALVVVPPAAHAPVALEALDAGLHCLIEKPFAPTVDEAWAVVERAEAVGRSVMISQNFRFRRGAATVRRLIESGALGAIGAVYVRFLRAPSFSGYRLEMDEPFLADMAIHHFDQIRALGLEPVRVWAHSFNPPWSAFRGNAAATVLLETRDGAVVSYVGSWASRGRETGWDGIWEIHGERGAIGWDGDRVLLVGAEPPGRSLLDRILRREPGRERVPLASLEAEDRLGSLAEFAAALREGREPVASGRDNLRTLALVAAALESATRGEPVRVEEPAALP